MAPFWVRVFFVGATIVLALAGGSRFAVSQSPATASSEALPNAAPEAPSPFAPCLDATSGNATIIIPATARVTVNGHALAPGDEIAAIDAAGHCVGRLVWPPGGGALTVWEAGLFRTAPAGLHPGDPIALHVWKRDAQQLFTEQNSTLRITLDTSAPYLRETLRYQRNGMYVIEAIVVESGL